MHSRIVVFGTALVFATVANAFIDIAKAEVGVASWYGPGFCGRRTASGERFDCSEMTAAHRSLGFGSHVRVVDLAADEPSLFASTIGPFVRGRVIDLSPAAKTGPWNGRRNDARSVGATEVILAIS
jgi:rare lipoprotein A